MSIPQWKPGDGLTAANLNARGVDPINRLAGVGNAEISQPLPGHDARYSPVRATVREIHDDYLVCKKSSEPDDAPTVLVAKPRALRVSDFNGTTKEYPDGEEYQHAYFDSHRRHRIRVSDSTIQMDTVWPPYISGDSQIWIALQPDGTNLEVDGITVRYLDLNEDGRAFVTEGVRCTPRDPDAGEGDTTPGYLYSRQTDPPTSDADDGKIREGAMIDITLNDQHADEYIKIAHRCPVNESTKDTLGSAAERLTNDSATWASCGSNGLELYVLTGFFYDHSASTPALTAQVRKLTFDRFGHLYAVAAETSYVVDTPEDCA